MYFEVIKMKHLQDIIPLIKNIKHQPEIFSAAVR